MQSTQTRVLSFHVPNNRVGRAGQLMRDILKHKFLYLMILPGIVYFLVFRYIPMYGLVIAFQDFTIFRGIWHSPWAGLVNFQALFLSPQFPLVLKNTIIISLLKLAFGFPAPIILALLLNEIRVIWFKKVVQTLSYLPYFLSWVVMVGIIGIFINQTDGVITLLVKSFGGKMPDVQASNTWFRGLLVVTDMYKGVGFGSIIYLAAMSGIDPQLYEAAIMDGAGKLKLIWHITLPSIRGVIVVMLILSLGGILNAGFDQVYLLYNPLVYETGDIIDTWVYRKGIVDASYSLAAAATLFKSVIGLILIVVSNAVANRLTDREASLW